jgi:alpha-1,6-mannosyltransferase
MNSEREAANASNVLPTLCLLLLALGIASAFAYLRSQLDLRSHAPEAIAALLAAGGLYLIASYLIQRFDSGLPALVVILGAALAFRFLVLSAGPALSSDVYRYQWEGRVQRAGINPYSVHPDALRRLGLEDPTHPLEVGRTTPTLYPPLSEWSFSWMKTIPGYKRLYMGLDVASIVVLLLLLRVRKQPLARVLVYAWNPGVVVAFAMCGHHDSLAILALLAANLFIIRQQGALSIFFLALSFLSKFFSGLILPVFLTALSHRGPRHVILSEAKDLSSFSSPRGSPCVYAVLFLSVAAVGFLPYASAGRKLLDGLSQYAAVWQNNDSLFRLMMMAGNSRAQAGLLAAVFLAALMIWALKRRLEPLEASLALIAGLLLLSPNAFPWYFTWMIPFLCFHPHPAMLLMSVTCVLGYSPVVAYAAGQPYVDSPLILTLEYAPVFAWLGLTGVQTVRKKQAETGSIQAS